MPAIASIEDLRRLDDEIKAVKHEHPEACKKIIDMIKKNRKLGYKNFCKLFTAERSPEALKSDKKNTKMPSR